jgi:hypothetical protein
LCTNIFVSEEAFAEDEIGVGEVCDSLQHNLTDYVRIVFCMVQLVQLEDG